MSRWTIFGTMLGGVGGAVVAAIAVLEYMAINDEPDAVRRINELIASDVNLSDPAVLEAAFPLAALMAQNVNAMEADDVALLPNIADAGSDETVSFLLPDGGRTFVTFRWNNVPPAAYITFEGEGAPARPGWVGDVTGSPCQILFVGPTRDEPAAGRFQRICDE